MIIDFHTNIGDGMHFNCDAGMLLAEMEENSVDMAVICPVEQYLSVKNKEGNNLIGGLVKEFSDRFIGFGTVSPWYGKDSIEEIKRIKTLGLKGIKFHPFYQGFLLNDEIIYPLMEECEKQNLPVMFHTGTPICASPFQLRDLASRFPKVNFIMGHMGWSDFWYDVIEASKGLSNIFLEASYQMPSLILSCINEVGADRVLFGSDWPYSRIKIEKNKIDRIENIRIREKVLGSNACKVLDL